MTIVTYEATITGTDAAGTVATGTMIFEVDLGDTTAPVLSAASAAAEGQTAAAGSVTTDEAGGTLHWVVAAGTAVPGAAQVVAGQNAGGAAAAAAGSQAVTAAGAQAIAVAGLAAGTGYRLHAVHEDAAANRSAVASSAAFTTEAAGAPNAASAPVQAFAAGNPGWRNTAGWALNGDGTCSVDLSTNNQLETNHGTAPYSIPVNPGKLYQISARIDAPMGGWIYLSMCQSRQSSGFGANDLTLASTGAGFAAGGDTLSWRTTEAIPGAGVQIKLKLQIGGGLSGTAKLSDFAVREI